MLSAIDHTPRRRHPALRRTLLALLTFAAILLPILFYAPRLARRVSFLRWQSRCMNHAFPPDTLICDYDTDLSPAADPPPPFASLIDLVDNDTAGYISSTAPTVFLHARTSSAGERLVILRVGPVGSAFSELNDDFDVVPIATLTFTVLSPGTFAENPRVLTPPSAQVSLALPAYGHHAKLFAAYPDPANPAAIIVPYESDGTRHTETLLLTEGNWIIQK